MSATANALAELRKKIEDNRKLLQEQEHALEVLEKMMGIPSTQGNSLSSIAASSSSVSIVLGELDGAKPTLNAQVSGVLSKIGDQEFTAGHIESALNRAGITVNGQHPRARIAMVLAKLQENGEIERTVSGTGKNPHRYRVVPANVRELI